MKVHDSFPPINAVEVPAPSFLRIAIPSWRWVGFGRHTPRPEPHVSKGELQELFDHDLRSNPDWRKSLTQKESDQLEKSQSARNALYCDPRRRS